MEQSYKQVKHALGWSAYQVRSDHAIRRHWQLACCAFTFCWWAYGRLPTDDEPTERPEDDLPAGPAGRGGKETRGALAGSLEGGEGVAGTVGELWRYWKAFSDNLPPPELRELLERVFSGKGLYLYVR